MVNEFLGLVKKNSLFFATLCDFFFLCYKSVIVDDADLISCLLAI